MCKRLEGWHGAYHLKVGDETAAENSLLKTDRNVLLCSYLAPTVSSLHGREASPSAQVCFLEHYDVDVPQDMGMMALASYWNPSVCPYEAWPINKMQLMPL